MFLQYYVNYQQDDWTNWLAAAEFQYNDKKHTATGRTPFKLNFERHPWKRDLMVQTDIPWVENFLIRLQKSWEQATKAMEEAQKSIKKQFDKKILMILAQVWPFHLVPSRKTHIDIRG